MNNITLKQVYDALTRKISKVYPQKEIYGSSVHQNLDEGDFNVIPISATITGQMGDRVQIKALFDCLYYSEDYENLLDISEGLPLAVRQIETESGDIIHGILNSPTTEISDGVLHCIVSYEYFGLVKQILPEGEEAETDLMYYLRQQLTEVKQ